jgi:hypothetical protein
MQLLEHWGVNVERQDKAKTKARTCTLARHY